MDIQIQHVIRGENQLADVVTNKTCEQQMKISIQSESQLTRACKGIVRLDMLQLPSLRIKTRKICIQG